MAFRLGVFEHFFDRRCALENASQAILPQRHHAEFNRLLFQHNRRRALVDQLADRIVDLHQFVDPLAPFVAGVVAGIATFAVEEILLADVASRELELIEKCLVRLISGAALRTDAPEQALAENGFEGGGNEEWFDAHVDQTRDRARCVSGV